MAMTKCGECGAEISTTAVACPRCGAKQRQTSGCAKVALAGILLVVAVSIIGTCSRSEPATPPPPLATQEAQNANPAPHDDLSLFISKFGEPDRVESSENEKPRPPIVTKRLTYAKERVRVTYVVDGPLGAGPPYAKWKLLGFQDPRTNAVLQPAEAVSRLEKRRVR